jgi:3-dehydroquinate dehydratase-2
VKVLLINGPNLNLLGSREPEVYGHDTLEDIVGRVNERAKALGVEVEAFQSNHEGAIIDFVQAQSPGADGIVINPGALTHYGLSLRDALAACRLPIVEVHISNIYTRETFRRRSVTAEVSTGVISGLGWHGYLLALEAVVGLAKEGKEP